MAAFNLCLGLKGFMKAVTYTELQEFRVVKVFWLFSCCCCEAALQLSFLLSLDSTRSKVVSGGSALASKSCYSLYIRVTK